ncbi:hypothetical protein [Exiguobacterium sp. 17-1]|uniref:hypothetical protein n=1 Tax=Exiguobacterium sp. 17-1 TaxID=2931981 RepID=UPI001FFE3C92|nr:hypothetical protein [Exiguobacterium sp. 17-1]MCK2159077.1 hypothetical protein [Exiguobacterium sp. 17-1]
MKVDLNSGNYDREKWVAIEKLKYLQVVEGLVMKVETLKVDQKGKILIDCDNPSHRDWFESE